MIKPQRPKPTQLRRIERIKPSDRIDEILKTGIDEKTSEWFPAFGQDGRFKRIFLEDLKKKPISFLLRHKKPNPNVLFLGPGDGNYIVTLNRYLSLTTKKPNYDVFSLTKHLSPEAEKIVRNDFSINIALETIIANPERYRELISKLKGEYDLIMAPMSIGVHTDWPDRNAFATALMLAPEGRAYITINRLKKDVNPRFRFENIARFVDLATRAYNKKHGTHLRFEVIKFQDNNYIQITRLS